MPKFTDAKGREWALEINVGTLKQVKSRCEVDLLDIGGEIFQRLAGDPFLLCDVLFVLCDSQAKECGVSDEQFGEGLVGDPIDEATEALLEGLLAFFPSRRRVLVEKALAKSKMLQQQATEHAAKVLDSDKLDKVMVQRLEAMDAEIESRLATIGIESGNSPESSE